MIPCEQINRDAGIGELCNFSKQPGIPFWYSSFIFKPKIKQVAHQVQFSGIVFYLIHPLDDTLFTLHAFLFIRSAQMKIGSEVYIFSVGSLRISHYLYWFTKIFSFILMLDAEINSLSYSLLTPSLISSTTVGSINVLVSPKLAVSPSAILRRILRIILPERVLGNPLTN